MEEHGLVGAGGPHHTGGRHERQAAEEVAAVDQLRHGPVGLGQGWEHGDGGRGGWGTCQKLTPLLLINQRAKFRPIIDTSK